MKYCFGADVGGTTIKLGLFTVDGEILDKWEIITRTENEGESILQDIATALKEKIQEKAIPAEEVIGIGDNGNDIPMLEAVGLPCCPNNAIDEVKKISKYVSPYTNNDSAIADIIEKFCLKIQ